jgi:hypothetical protein
MVVVVMYFLSHTWSSLPQEVAFMPLSALGRTSKGEYICKPAGFTGTKFTQRRSYRHMFGHPGISTVALPTWR